jgi:RimJ/RimL family protein N-acetyltransferase
MRYICLDQNVFEIGKYKIVPIRSNDRYDIMKWRNEQVYHLRQTAPLTIENQDIYFQNVVAQLFDQQQPNQILFSFLVDDVLVGYGGLVHINWLDRNAEISFLMNTSIENEYFEEYWKVYLSLIELVAFKVLRFHKIYTYAFDIRPHLYPVLLSSGFLEDARLKEHYFFNNKLWDILIHSKINKQVYSRPANLNDIELYFNWANDDSVRMNSYSSELIPYESHVNWFKNNLNKDYSLMLVFENDFKQAIGQVRIQKFDSNSAIIGISIDANFRGKSYSSRMIASASQDYFLKYQISTIHAYIKCENLPSKLAFEKAGYTQLEIIDFENTPSYHLVINNENR